MSHANATLTPQGRLKLARLIVEEGWSYARAAERFSVSATTARRWAGRYRRLGAAGMRDLSSRPRFCPHQLDRRTEHRIVGLRVTRRWGAGPDRLPPGAESLDGPQGPDSLPVPAADLDRSGDRDPDQEPHQTPL